MVVSTNDMISDTPLQNHTMAYMKSPKFDFSTGGKDCTFTQGKPHTQTITGTISNKNAGNSRAMTIQSGNVLSISTTPPIRSQNYVWKTQSIPTPLLTPLMGLVLPDSRAK